MMWHGSPARRSVAEGADAGAAVEHQLDVPEIFLMQQAFLKAQLWNGKMSDVTRFSRGRTRTCRRT